MGGIAARLTLFVAVLASTVPMALSCEPIIEPSVVEAASRGSVTGVVERQTLAANPLPWGRSVSAATRVWGDVTIERWQTSDRRGDGCPSARYREVGIVEYDFVAPPGTWAGPVDGTVEVLDVASEVVLEQRFGDPAELDLTGLDRAMAWLRVFPSVLAVPFVGFAGVVAVRTRRRKGDEYLF